MVLYKRIESGKLFFVGAFSRLGIKELKLNQGGVLGQCIFQGKYQIYF